MNISLPDPALVLLIGVSGSGKSTFARRHFASTEIISSDHCRALVCDDENDQSVNQDAFEILHLIARKRLAHHKLTVIDATNVQSAARRHLLDLAREREISAVAIVLHLAEEICVQQNLQRSHRVVAREVIQQQINDLRLSLSQLSAEGFSQTYLLTTPQEINSAMVLR